MHIGGGFTTVSIWISSKDIAPGGPPVRVAREKFAGTGQDGSGAVSLAL